MAKLARQLVRSLPTPFVKRIAALQFRSPMAAHLISRYKNAITSGDDVIDKGVGKGLKINVSGSNIGYALGTTEPDIQNAMKAVCQRGWTCYDIGANIGFYSLILGRLVGQEGRVYSFEPLPENSDGLTQNALLNPELNIAVVPIAVGNSVGNASFCVAPLSTQGKLLSVNSANPARQKTIISVHIARIDDLVFGEKYPVPDLIKIDVEGAELDVIDGMKSVLLRCRPILFCELHGNQNEMSQRLQKCGYTYVLSTGHEDLNEAPWWAFVVAAPLEKASALHQVKLSFSHP